MTGSPDVNAEGEFVRPPPTPEDCATAAAIVEKFLAMTRGEFRRVDLLESIPGNVSIYVGRMRPWGSPYPVGSPVTSDPNRRHGVSWLSDRIVVVVIETSDFGGPTTTVVIADIETHQVCEFPRWPDTEDPRNLSVEEIQEVLDSGLLGDRVLPECHLAPLPID